MHWIKDCMFRDSCKCKHPTRGLYNEDGDCVYDGDSWSDSCIDLWVREWGPAPPPFPLVGKNRPMSQPSKEG